VGIDLFVMCLIWDFIMCLTTMCLKCVEDVLYMCYQCVCDGFICFHDVFMIHLRCHNEGVG